MYTRGYLYFEEIEGLVDDVMVDICLHPYITPRPSVCDVVQVDGERAVLK